MTEDLSAKNSLKYAGKKDRRLTKTLKASSLAEQVAEINSKLDKIKRQSTLSPKY